MVLARKSVTARLAIATAAPGKVRKNVSKILSIFTDPPCRIFLWKMMVHSVYNEGKGVSREMKNVAMSFSYMAKLGAGKKSKKSAMACCSKAEQQEGEAGCLSGMVTAVPVTPDINRCGQGGFRAA
jgi:hypothetical protein